MPKNTILITGANGLVAQRFADMFSDEYALKFLTRKRNGHKEKHGHDHNYAWDPGSGHIDEEALEGTDYILHLAGANISEKRWTAKRKQEILSSRRDSARLLLSKLIEGNHSLKAFISASAVGFYGDAPSEKVFSEEDEGGEDFLAAVCREWEESSHNFSEVSLRVLIFRFGVVLSRSGFILTKLQMPIKFGMGT
ncbi:MAG: NAD-dependent epimerase/dehydratase family protein, partial [Syntrophobacterales bacterium]|nr:NAD-dependent epimerase/dehydratase family protein [Syntrophobacterales bacterium]